MRSFKNPFLFFIVVAAIIATLLFKVEMTKAAGPQKCGTWSSIASPNRGSLSNYFDDVAATTTKDVWAVGDDAISDSATRTLIEHWDGSKWSIMASPSPLKTFNYLTGVAAISSTDAWAVGSYSNNGPSQTLIEHWNGSTWSTVASPNPSSSDGLVNITAISSNDIWADGGSLLIHWNGKNWSVVPTPSMPSSQSGMGKMTALSATNIWAIGAYYNQSNTLLNFFEHWNGATWSIVPSPNVSTYVNSLSGISAVSTNDIWAVGDEYPNPNAYPLTIIEHWNGSSWSMVAAPTTPYNSDGLQSVTAISTNNVWAFGGYESALFTTHLLIEHWNGQQWSIVPSPDAGSSPALSSSVRIPGTTSVWAVGYEANSAGTNRTLSVTGC